MTTHRLSRPLILTLGLMLAAPLGLGACSDDDGNGECQGAFCVQDAPALAFTPDERRIEIVDVAMQPGETTTRTFRIINVGTGDLRVRDISLNYKAPEGANDGGTPPFRVQPLPVELPFAVKPFGGESFPQGLEIIIEYTRKSDSLPRSVEVQVDSNDIRNPRQTILITTDAGAPRIATSPARVDFGLVPRSTEPTARPLTLLNTGSRTLNVSGFKLARDGRFGVRGPDFAVQGPEGLLGIDLPEAIEVPPGQSVSVLEVTFLSDSPAPAEGDLIIYSDDPSLAGSGHVVSLVANKSGPCIVATPRAVDFGGKLVGTVSTIDVKVESCGTEPLELKTIALGPESSLDFELDFSKLPEGFEAGPNPLNPVRIPVNESVTIGVVYVPDAVNPRDANNVPIPDEGRLLLGSNAFEAELPIDVRGAGSDVDCPTPVISVAQGEEVVPQTVLNLSGRQSYAPFGGITAYNWSITQWPEGTPRPVMLPSFTDPTPLVEVNSVGTYTFKLNVRDEYGNRSGAGACPDAEYTVLVQPDQAIHIELTWVTPNAAATTEDGEGRGTDLDLHFAHQNAVGPDLDGDEVPDPWFDQTWDVFWYNPEPNWGSFDPGARDDPSLDRDDIDGGGPENLNLAVPEDGTTYRIGVHYWNDWRFGVVDANVKVFHYAELVYEATLPAMQPLDFWCVGSIHWPVAEVERCAPEGDPERVTPRYVNPFFQPPFIP
jgi:hypothetical protein